MKVSDLDGTTSVQGTLVKTDISAILNAVVNYNFCCKQQSGIRLCKVPAVECVVVLHSSAAPNSHYLNCQFECYIKQIILITTVFLY